MTWLFGSSPFPQAQDHVKREQYDFSLYATPAVHEVVGVARRESRFAEAQLRAFDRTDYSVYTAPVPSVPAMTMPQKRQADSNSTPGPGKHIKAEHPEEFSNAVKKRLQSSTRTGQACDRCKVLLSNLHYGATALGDILGEPSQKGKDTAQRRKGCH